MRDLLVSFDGLHHQEVRPTGTKSGRISGAFHTTPRDWKIRSIYDAPPGWVRGGGDYSQIETRLCAWAAAGKPTTLRGAIGMLAAFRDHRDVYVETAAEILGKPEHEVTTDKADPKNERQIMGKVPTLAKEYRISAKGFQEYAWAEHQLELSRGQAAMICKKWDQKWPEFQRWHRLVEAMVRERGWVMSDVGRVRHLPAAKGRGYEAEEAIRQAINSPIQDCHAFGTRVLTEDMRWVPVESLRTGDRLMGFEENLRSSHKARRWLPSVVEYVEHVETDCYEVTLENGDTVICTSDHRHLTANVAGFVKWTKTQDLRCDSGGNSRLVKLMTPTKGCLTDWERGYVAGMFDADGSFSLTQSRVGVSRRLTLAQVDNVCLIEVQRILAKAGFKQRTYKHWDKPKENWTPCNVLEVQGGFSEALRFLCTFRPFRLIQKLGEGWERWGNIRSRENIKVVSVVPVGKRMVSRFSTSTATYIAEGYATHNCAFEITARAHILLDKELDPDKAFVTSNVHDAVYLRMREDDVDEIMQLVTEVMLYAPISLRDLGFYIPSDLVEVETGIGAWGIEEKWETHTPSLTDHINPAMVAIEEGHRNETFQNRAGRRRRVGYLQ